MDKFTHAIMGLYQLALRISKDTHQILEGDFKDQNLIWIKIASKKPPVLGNLCKVGDGYNKHFNIVRRI